MNQVFSLNRTVCYASSQKCFLCYDLDKKKPVSHDVMFKKNVFHYQHHSPSLPPILHPTLFYLYLNHWRPFLNVLNLGLFIKNDSLLSPVHVCCSSHKTSPPDHYVYSPSSFFSFLNIFHVPNSFNQVVVHPCWQKAMDEELEVLTEDHIWDLHVHLMLKLLRASGCIVLNLNLMALWTGAKLV